MKYIREDYLLKLMESPGTYGLINSADVADAPGAEMLTCDECVYKKMSIEDAYCRNPLFGDLVFDVIYNAGLPCPHGIKRKAEVTEITEDDDE